VVNAKHTPGPWKVYHPVRRDGVRKGIVSDQGADIVIFGCEEDDAGVCGGSDYEAEANARLIAAAPDLLAAARLGLNFIENTESEMGEKLASGDALRAAIAKARGA